jgi:16S rRNA (cytidine1402-2'-O)-methyltransferase
MIPATDIKNNKLKPGLYVVSTPIGNLGDISLRALDVLRASEYIFCEDTRVSKKLLEKYKIKSKLLSNHKFNEKSNISNFIKILVNNKIVSIISDAGTPSISDPGAILLIFFQYLDLLLFLLQFQLVDLMKNFFFMVFFQKKIVN